MSSIQLGTKENGGAFNMPADFATQTCGIIARKGAGKTYTGSVAAEEMLDAHVQVVVIDPLDVWWGLRSSANGKAKGYSVVVFGGEHGDLPLVAESGSLIADLVVEHRLSAVLSLDHLSKSGQRQFMTAFSEQLYQRKNPSTQRTPVHLILDEADMFCPQRIQHGEERMMGAVDSLVRRGRTRGIGVTMITQRPATIHKDVFTQIEVLIALQLTSPQDRKAVDDWVKGNDADGHRDQFMASLASLKQGQAWVWSPSWMQCFELIQVRQRKTFNSSATPKAGESIKAPVDQAVVDIKALNEQLATVIEQAEKNDPARLKKRIAELEKALKAAGPSTVTPSADALAEAEQRGLLRERAVTKTDMLVVLKSIDGHLAAIGTTALGPLRRLAEQDIRIAQPVHRPAPAAVRPAKAPNRLTDDSDCSLGRGERAILTALAQYPQGLKRARVGMLTGYSHKGGSFQTYLSRLRSSELIDGSDPLVITETGLAELGSFKPLPTGQELVAYWLSRLGKGERTILEALVAAYPGELSRHALGEATGYAADGGSFQTYLSRLRTLELISGRGDLKVSDDLMEST